MEKHKYTSPKLNVTVVSTESLLTVSYYGSPKGYGNGGNMIDDGLDINGGAGNYGAGNDMFGGE